MYQNIVLEKDESDIYQKKREVDISPLSLSEKVIVTWINRSSDGLQMTSEIPNYKNSTRKNTANSTTRYDITQQ